MTRVKNATIALMVSSIFVLSWFVSYRTIMQTMSVYGAFVGIELVIVPFIIDLSVIVFYLLRHQRAIDGKDGRFLMACFVSAELVSLAFNVITAPNAVAFLARAIPPMVTILIGHVVIRHTDDSKNGLSYTKLTELFDDVSRENKKMEGVIDSLTERVTSLSGDTDRLSQVIDERDKAITASTRLERELERMRTVLDKAHADLGTMRQAVKDAEAVGRSLAKQGEILEKVQTELSAQSAENKRLRKEAQSADRILAIWGRLPERLQTYCIEWGSDQSSTGIGQTTLDRFTKAVGD